ncbi:MAG: glycine--tRNA ligase [Oscillospiraceae bacterium]|nr:glycine--tRNA ligase [Oscillospiraceae bacterium]
MCAKKDIKKIVSLCKARGFVYANSEIYGGLSNTWDYGPLGVLLKNNIKAAFLKKFVQENEYNLQIDTAILMNPKVWEVSGHISQFSDPLIDCRSCKTRHRADKLIKELNLGNFDDMSLSEMSEFIKNNKIKCPNCGNVDFTSVRNFNLMFKTFQGITEDKKDEIYLRPETAQGIFVNFLNILRTTRRKIPFGVVQIGKSFRNEITPGNFIFRTREFEQMELEFFCKPKESFKWLEYWKNFCKNWLLSLKIFPQNIRFKDHSEKELSHYSKVATDIEFLFPFGWGELWGIAHRGSFDLTNHQRVSKKKLEVFDEKENLEYLPEVIEPSLGLDRVFLALICNAYEEENVKEETRVVLKLHKFLAPFKAAVLPLSKKLSSKAYNLFLLLSKKFQLVYDETGSIGKRYRRQDEIGTPFCITYDFDSEKENTVTIRDRDTMKQTRVKIEEVEPYITDEICF